MLSRGVHSMRAASAMLKPLSFRGGVGVGPVLHGRRLVLSASPTPNPSPEGEGLKATMDMDLHNG